MAGRTLKLTPRSLLRSLVVCVLVSVVSGTALAQQPVGTDVRRERATQAGPRRQLATIIFTGLGGAVLGLSTLSFYGRPQDKLSNIAIGGAFGIIAGTIYVTYNAATNPQEFYGQNSSSESKSESNEQNSSREFYGQNSWMEFERSREVARRHSISATPTLNVSFTF